MKRITFSILVTLILYACGQKQNSAISTISSQDSIEYYNRAIAFIKEVMSQEIQDTSFFLDDIPYAFNYLNRYESLIIDTFQFSKEELMLLKKGQFQKIDHWTKEAFPNIKLINGDTINMIFSDKDKGWNYFYKNIGREINTFSFPIFFKNYKYCLFYSDNACGGLCGSGKLILYEYDGKKWKEKKNYGGWIS